MPASPLPNAGAGPTVGGASKAKAVGVTKRTSMGSQPGTALLVVQRCAGLRSVQKFLNQDPYVTAWVEDESAPLVVPVKRSTRAINFGGTAPSWHSGNELELSVSVPMSKVRVQVWDKEMFNKDRLISEGSFSLAPYEEDGAEDLEIIVPLEFEGKPAGEVYLTMSYEPVDSQETPKFWAPPRTSRAKQVVLSWSAWALSNPKVSGALAAAPLLIWLLWELVYGILMFTYNFAWLLVFSVALPLVTLIYGPAWLGWAATFGLSFVVHDYPIVFGAIHITPWIRFGQAKVYLRVAVEDFSVGSPPNLGFTNPCLVGARRVSTICSVSFEDLWNFVRLVKRPMPLAKVPDFEGWLILEVELLHVEGFTFDMEVARGRLNINEMTRTFAVGDVAAHKGMLNIPSEIVETDPRWPNLLEVQVVRARNLLAMDSNGKSDPYAVVAVRGQKYMTQTKMETLNPMWNSEIYRFAITDPSAVLHVQLWDRDFGMQSDYLGQWIITLKHLVIDPKHCRYTSMEVDEDGWIDAWLPLADARWQNVGKCGELNLRLRWRADGSAPPPLVKVQKAIDQITENSNESRLRLGDMDELTDVLNHVPILFNFKLVMVTEARVSIKDLFKSKSATKREMKRQGGSTGSGVKREHSSSFESASNVPAPVSPTKTLAKKLGSSSFSSSSDAPGNTYSSSSLPPAKVMTTNYPSSTSLDDGASSPPPPQSAQTSASPRRSGLSNRLRKFSSSMPNGPEAGDEDDEDDDEDDDDLKRPYVHMPTIRWKTQFAPRHGDPGITVYKVVDRFFRGLLPKLAAHSKLNMVLMSQSTSGLFSILGDDFAHLILRGNRMPSAILGAAKSVATQASLTTHFIKHKTMSLSASPAPLPSRNLQATLSEDALLGAMDETVSLPPGSDTPMLRVEASDGDFLHPAILSGILEVCWSGTYVPAGAGFRWFGAKRTAWSTWVFEIKGKSIFCKRNKALAKDRRLCVELIADMDVQSGEEITVSFDKGACLHLRETRGPSKDMPPLEQWAKAFNTLMEDWRRS